MSLFNFLRSHKKTSNSDYFALVDVETNSLLLIGTDHKTLNCLEEYTLDTFVVNVPYKDVFTKYFIRNLVNCDFIYEYKWKFIEKKVYPNTSFNEQIIQKSKLAKFKYYYLNLILNHVEQMRSKYDRQILSQNVIYLTKKLQAEQFKNINYDETKILNFPYVMQYADVAEMSYRQATDLILFKAKSYDNFLCKTETLRLRYFNRIKEAQNAEDVEKVFLNFLLDFNVKI